ncbi:undecaprenyl-diphosphatase [Paenibacillus sp. RC67]|uniref:undecaprenyl-diphosphatase n=1 Tax=Paenibacillus sp. RC67 TaxID=3039392 RepID=UPI0024ADCFA8|nr:undecaprenyl-diphosphatase [Paenibacillus sp. RC67]
MVLEQFDYQWFQTINHLGAVYTWLNPLMRFFAEDAEYLFFAGVIVYWFSRKASNRTMVGVALLSACLAMGFGSVLGHFFYRDRPFVTHSVIQLIKHAGNASFPSDHAMGAFAIAAAFWLYKPSTGKVWLTVAACIALSRVWTGVHYPLDVIAGAVIGAATALIVYQLVTRFVPLSRALNSIIAWYDRLEYKLWYKKKEKRSLNS